jgi:Tol biopolymer transport system component
MDIDGSNNKMLDLTPVSDRNPFWDNNSKGIYFLSSKTGSQQVYYYSLDDKSVKQITDLYMGIDDPILSLDGKYIAFKKQATPGFESDIFRLVIYNRITHKSKILTNSFDNWVNDYKWTNDSREIYFTGSFHGYSPIYKVNVESQKVEKVSDDRSVYDFDLSHGNKYLVYNASFVGKPMEIYRIEPDTGRSILPQFQETGAENLLMI